MRYWRTARAGANWRSSKVWRVSRGGVPLSTPGRAGRVIRSRDAPRGRRPGSGPVDSGERRTLVSRCALYRHHIKESGLGSLSRALEERWMRRFAWAMLGLGLWVLDGGVEPAAGQDPQPTIELQ